MKVVRRLSARRSRPAANPDQPAVVHTSLYLPLPMYEALRTIAFEERCKIHSLVLEGIAATLRKRGYTVNGEQ
jgi:hypothetical protein